MNLLQNRIKQAEFVRTVWSATPEPGVTLDDMAKPSYWAHIAKTLKAGDRIEVTSDDGEWIAELIVRSADSNSANVAVIQHQEFSVANVPEKATSTLVKHRGQKGWSVIRTSDKAVLFEGGATQADAESWDKANNLG